MAKAWRWFLAIVGGVGVTLGGLFWDAWIHSHEAEHMAEESLLNLSNPGHVVFGVGLVLTALIALAGFTLSWTQDRPPRRGWQTMSIPAALWLGIGLAGAFTLIALARTG